MTTTHGVYITEIQDPEFACKDKFPFSCDVTGKVKIDDGSGSFPWHRTAAGGMAERGRTAGDPPGSPSRRWEGSSVQVLDPADRAVIRIADERDQVQKKTFTKWVNKHLTKTCVPVYTT
uniref:Uncharacterized protein n=1 Tax=Branchiostoma floridae TaxID=7739 RepID=C3YBC6_BRAFL|eukprot:XP_002606273.1 hypothetical protein BRAFLDRAFT_83974 [Branchiostoma floridae]